MGGPCVGCVLCSRGTRASSLLSPPGLGTGPGIQQAFHNVCSVTNGKWRPREHLTEQGNFGLCPPPPIQGSVAPPLQPHLRGQLGLSQLDTAAERPLPRLLLEAAPPPPCSVPHALLLTRVPTLRPQGSHRESVPRGVCTSAGGRAPPSGTSFSWWNSRQGTRKNL